jgi:hypothetical protein
LVGAVPVLGAFSPPMPAPNGTTDYTTNLVYLSLGCICLVFAFAYNKAKR